METLARSLDQEAHPTAGFQDPEAGTCVNGSKRGAGSAPYDYMRDGVRVEVKSAMLT